MLIECNPIFSSESFNIELSSQVNYTSSVPNSLLLVSTKPYPTSPPLPSLPSSFLRCWSRRGCWPCFPYPVDLEHFAKIVLIVSFLCFEAPALESPWGRDHCCLIYSKFCARFKVLIRIPSEIRLHSMSIAEWHKSHFYNQNIIHRTNPSTIWEKVRLSSLQLILENYIYSPTNILVDCTNSTEWRRNCSIYTASSRGLTSPHLQLLRCSTQNTLVYVCI